MTDPGSVSGAGRVGGRNLNDQDGRAIQVWVCSRSHNLTALDTVNGDLLSLAVPLSGADGAAPPPTEIQISPGGEVQTETQGRFVMDAEAQAALIAQFTRAGHDLVIDYRHASLQEGQAPAAGWITRLISKGAQGLWAAVNWTEQAATYLRNREYRYLSPVLLVRKSDRRPVALHSVALTNTPETHKLLPLVASHEARADTQVRPYTDEEDRMKERLLTILKLSADATDEAIIAAILALVERPAIAPELREALALGDQATLSDATATIHALTQSSEQRSAVSGRLTALQAEVTTLREAAATRTRDELVTMALSQGKITPAQREWAEAYALRDPEGFRTFTAKAPAVAPVGGGVTVPLSQPAGSGGLDEGQRAINRALGVTDELYLKHAPKAA